MKHLFLSLFIFIFSIQLYAFEPSKAIGAKSASLGGVSLLPADFWSVFNNPAALGGQTYWGAGFAYDTYFALDKNLSMKSGGLLIPTKSGSFGLSMNYYGYSAYHEQKIGLAYGMQLGEKISVGVQLDYLSVAIGSEYGQASAVTFELGILAKLSENWTIASHVFNPFAVKIGKVNPQTIPATIKLATSYDIDQQVLLLAEYEQSIDEHGILKAGLEYLLIKQFSVRAGVATNPNLLSFGFGLHLKGLDIDIGTRYHQTLGFSPVVGLMYRIN